MLPNELHTSPNMMQIDRAYITKGVVIIVCGARSTRRQLAMHRQRKKVISTADKVAKLVAS